MPLLDHFHPHLRGQRQWQGFYHWWIATLAGSLNETLLPREYFAEFRADEASTAVQTRTWVPPTPVAVMPALFPDDFEVQVFSNVAGPVLVAAIELVSPGNKDRDETHRAFAAKCAGYLQRGIGLIIVDIVTSRHTNLHDELMALMRQSDGFAFPAAAPLYASAYRPAHRQGKNEIDLWRESLELGKPLPTLPLAVRGLGCLPIDLEATYMEARKRGRID